MSDFYSGLGSLFGGVAQGAFNYFANERTNEQNAEINKTNLLFNEEMWEREKEYDKPVNQMKRLIEAGINPAEAYSNGIQNTVGSAPTAPSAIPMQAYNGNELAEIGNRISLDAQRNQDIDESTSRVKLNGANALLVDKKTALTEEEINKVKAECNVLGEQVNLIIAQRDNLYSETALKQWQYDFNKRTENDQVQKLSNEVGLSANELSYLSATLQERITGVQLLNSKQRQEVEKLRKENAKYNDYYDAMISSIQANANKTGVEFNLLETYGDMEHAMNIISDAFSLRNFSTSCLCFELSN